nr:MAG TPA: hypothetical protein [Caudoviricetes sp.]
MVLVLAFNFESANSLALSVASDSNADKVSAASLSLVT